MANPHPQISFINSETNVPIENPGFDVSLTYRYNADRAYDEAKTQTGYNGYFQQQIGSHNLVTVSISSLEGWIITRGTLTEEIWALANDELVAQAYSPADRARMVDKNPTMARETKDFNVQSSLNLLYDSYKISVASTEEGHYDECYESYTNYAQVTYYVTLATWKVQYYSNTSGFNVLGMPEDRTNIPDGTLIEISSNVPIETPNAEHKFLGWSESASSTVPEYNPGATLTSSIHRDYSLYAIWKEELAYLEYDANGGTGAPGREYFDPDDTIQVFISSDIPTYSGHIFLGWASSASASTPQYGPGDLFTNGHAGANTLYAVWLVDNGSIDSIEHRYSDPEDQPPSGDPGDCSASWHISSVSGGAIQATGSISWEVTNILKGYEVSSIIFYTGSTHKGAGYSSSGTITNVQWSVGNPPNRAVIHWVFTGREHEVSVGAVDETGAAAPNCSAVINPGGVSSGTYANGEVISLVATAATGWEFLYWRKDNSSDNVSSAAIYNLSVDDSIGSNYLAYFRNTNQPYTVTITISPSDAETSGVAVSGNGDYTIGSSVTLTATPDVKEQYEFDHWERAGTGRSITSNPFTFTLEEIDVKLGLDFIAVFKASNMYQVLTQVIGENGTLTKSPDQQTYLPDTELTLTATSTASDYACLEMKNSQNNKVKNEAITATSVEPSLSHTYYVTADTVWTAVFQKYVRVTFHYGEGVSPGDITSGYRDAGYAFPGLTYGAYGALPVPTRENYYFKGWFSSYTDSEVITDGTTVPNSSSIALYAQWVNTSTKFYVSAEVAPSIYGQIAITTPPQGGEYFIGSDSCTVSVIANPTYASRYKLEKVEYFNGVLYQDTNLKEDSISFVVGDKTSWAYSDSGSESSDTRYIKLRFSYTNIAVPVYVEYVPSDGTMGTADCSPSWCTESSTSTVTAYPRTDIDVIVGKWERKINDGAWTDVTSEASNNEYVVLAPDAETTVINVRVTFGKLGGKLTYEMNGGIPQIQEQDYATNQAFNISSTLPTKEGNVFVGWGEGAASTLSFQPGDSATFTEKETTLYAIWYQTPQTISNVKHWDATTNTEYTGEKGTVQAIYVDNIVRTSTSGTLSGTANWNISPPETAGISEYPSIVKIEISTTGENSTIVTSTDLSGSESVSFSWMSEISSEWSLTIYYKTANLMATFIPNGGIGGPPEVSFQKSTPFQIPSDTPSREGYVFAGWSYDDAEASPTDPDLVQPGTMYGESGSGQELTLLDDITFYAIWAEGITITIIHHNTSTGEDSDEALSYARVWVTPTIPQQMEPYTVHWDIQNVLSEYGLVPDNTVIVRDGATEILRGSGSKGTGTYHSVHGIPSTQWVATINYYQKEYIITYDTQGGKPNIPDQKVIASADKFTITSIKPHRQGPFVFIGWDKNPNAGEPKYQPGQVVNFKTKSNITLYAIYEDESSGGGEESSGDESSGGEESSGAEEFIAYSDTSDENLGTTSPIEFPYAEGETVSFTATPTEQGEFSYWVDLAGGEFSSTNPTLTFIGTSAQDGHTYIAVFKQKEITKKLVYYVPTGLLMSYDDTLVWDDDGLEGCGDGGDEEG